jgi:hypothetical protein
MGRHRSVSAPGIDVAAHRRDISDEIKNVHCWHECTVGMTTYEVRPPNSDSGEALMKPVPSADQS